ncbi:hypothetical protein CVT25_003311 [Psilocybe cyanescens]|uniref:Uncharacterized protein n=1 Tax=Psilocybe cyanescens TaxID=93625 RepID=A0A409WMJ6_PSICY|nr:hypothetical protein CVT25_003311 [Psilocybe cyanescens]
MSISSEISSDLKYDLFPDIVKFGVRWYKGNSIILDEEAPRRPIVRSPIVLRRIWVTTEWKNDPVTKQTQGLSVQFMLMAQSDAESIPSILAKAEWAPSSEPQSNFGKTWKHMDGTVTYYEGAPVLGDTPIVAKTSTFEPLPQISTFDREISCVSGRVLNFNVELDKPNGGPRNIETIRGCHTGSGGQELKIKLRKEDYPVSPGLSDTSPLFIGRMKIRQSPRELKSIKNSPDLYDMIIAFLLIDLVYTNNNEQ